MVVVEEAVEGRGGGMGLGRGLGGGLGGGRALAEWQWEAVHYVSALWADCGIDLRGDLLSRVERAPRGGLGATSMIYVGIDDTDTLDTRGTNQLARRLAERVGSRFRCLRITRHQLLDDPRVPYTSKNGSASLVLEPHYFIDEPTSMEQWLLQTLITTMREQFIVGSDPGLCVAREVPRVVREFGERCQRELVSQSAARRLAADERMTLIGLGGTEDGVIGALAAVGLAAEANDGRIVQLGESLEGISQRQSLAELTARGIEVRCADSQRVVSSGHVNVGKKLRPNWRDRRCVLFVRRLDGSGHEAEECEALKLP